MLTERSIINALILTATFVLAPFIIAETLSADFLPALIAAGVFLLIVAFFFMKETLCAAPWLGRSIAGTLNFLPLPIEASQIAVALLIVYYITGFVLLTQRPITIGRPIFFWPMLIVTGIVLYHVHTLSLGTMGGNTEGARPAYFMYAYTLAYFCGINLPTPSVRFLSRIPFYALCLTALSCIPYLLTTFFPALAPYFYTFTGDVNIEAYANTAGGTQDVAFNQLTSKLAVLGPLGACLQMYLISHYPIGTWFSPSRLWVPILSFFCFVITIFCGYRSDLFGFFFLTLVGAWCYYSWRALFIPTLGIAMVLVVITASSNNIIHLPLRDLPMIAQRTMSFLPGDWDEEAIESGKGSNDFRQNIIDVYMDEYAREHPVFGNGFEINKDEFNSIQDSLKKGYGDGRDPAYLQAKLFIVGKMYHTGWISVYDCVGIVGWAAFLAFQLALVFVTGQFIFGKKADRRSALFPLYVFIQCTVTTTMASYYTVFGSFSQAYTDGICIAIVLVHLSKLKKQNELAAAPGDIKAQVEFSGLSQTNYGNKYY
jgi:hypothetical protein